MQGGGHQLPPGPARFVCTKGLFQRLKKMSKNMDFHQQDRGQLLKLKILMG